jgi:hypothetical protein
MPEQVTDRHIPANWRAGQIGRQRLVKIETALVDELQHDRGNEWLGDAPHPKHR